MHLNLKHLLSGSDVRGVALGENAELTTDAAAKIGYAFAKWYEQKTGKKLKTAAIGRDSRLTGEALAEAFALGLITAGVRVLDTGLATSPAMFMLTKTPKYGAEAGIMITASHMPKDRNGIKIVTEDGGLAPGDVAKILALAEDIVLDFEPGGAREPIDFMPEYAAGLVETVRARTGKERPLEGAKIVVDAGNGAGGFFVRDVLVPLGADTDGSRYLEPDGSFPNHIPNPEDAAAIAAIEQAVLENGADMGIIFDTDVDRSAIVDEQRRPINKSAFIAFIAGLLLEDAPGAVIVTDSVTSTGLADYIKRHGGRHHRFKRGYKNVIDEAKRLNAAGENAVLAMETSGHGAVKENYFLDDGAYLAVLSLAAFARAKEKGLPVSEYLADYHYPLEECEIRLVIDDTDFKKAGADFIEAFKDYAKAQPGWSLEEPNYEGVRVNCGPQDGWILVRQSLHEPKLPVNIESDAPGGAAEIEARFRAFAGPYKTIH